MTNTTTGSGNVYADLGYPEAKTMQAKAQIVASISQTIETKMISLDHAARAIGATKDELNRLLAGHFQAYSLGQLERMRKEIHQCTKT